MADNPHGRIIGYRGPRCGLGPIVDGEKILSSLHNSALLSRSKISPLEMMKRKC